MVTVVENADETTMRPATYYVFIKKTVKAQNMVL
jgi:hypothetical protein